MPDFAVVSPYMPRKRKSRRFNPAKDRCYMCNAIPTGDEHAPAQAFFPPQYQGKSLETVPSCDKHNGANAKDVEYVRGVMCIQYGTNKTGEEVFEKAKGSWDKSPKLFNRSFDGMVKAEVVNGENSEEIGVFEMDLPRVKNVMSALAHALYYREKGHAWHGNFDVFCAFHSKKSLQGLPDGSERVGNWLAARKYIPRATLHPDVFEYQIHDEAELIFAMRFYGGPWIYARRTGLIIASPGPPILTAIH